MDGSMIHRRGNLAYTVPKAVGKQTKKNKKKNASEDKEADNTSLKKTSKVSLTQHSPKVFLQDS